MYMCLFLSSMCTCIYIHEFFCCWFLGLPMCLYFCVAILAVPCKDTWQSTASKQRLQLFSWWALIYVLSVVHGPGEGGYIYHNA